MSMRPLVMSFLVLACVPAARALTFDELRAESSERFIPARPTVSVRYDVTYRLLRLQLRRMAEMRMDTTEGYWLDRATGARTPAAMMEMWIDSPDEADAEKRRRVSIHNRFLSVLTMPELDTILYAKEADESLRPLLGANREARYLDVYDLRDGTLAYLREDYLAGTVTNALEGTEDLANQGADIANVLKVMSSVYYGREEYITSDSDFRIFFNVDGVVKPFAVTTRQDESPDMPIGDAQDSLRVDVRLAPEAEGKGGKMSLWATSLADFAEAIEDRELLEVAAFSPAWSMIPLVADYDLAIGFIRCSLREAEVGEDPASAPE